MENKLSKIEDSSSGLRKYQIEIIQNIISDFQEPYIQLSRNQESDLISNDILLAFGDLLRIHHSFSFEPFSKDKFEYMFVKVLNDFGIKSYLASKGNPGHDIIIGTTAVSLKTEAERSIKSERIHISKFMELGKGEWNDDPEQLHFLLNRYLEHLKHYQRILTLRCLSRNPWYYELVEIPKELLMEAKNGQIIMMSQSRQMPKPGYCNIMSSSNSIKFQLYFDGGSERKLQIKNLDKSYCTIHSVWKFSITP